MLEIKGKVNTAICYAKVIEEDAIEQIRTMCDYELTKDSKIRIMPDVHAGAGCTIGTTMTVIDKACPNVVGVDIGCGMYTVKLKEKELDFEKIDEVCHYIPSGKNVWEGREERFDLEQLRCRRNLNNTKRLERSLGTLGGGNHFIELQEDDQGMLAVMIHSGSRHFGKSVCDYFHYKARQLNQKWYSQVPDEYRLAFLPVDSPEGRQYLRWMQLSMDFAKENREKMMLAVKAILEKYIGKYTELDLKFSGDINCHHNYASLETHYGKEVWVHRKGAVRAENGELAVIPGAMGSYSYVVMGKGNQESFCSCSHGAGRKYSRKGAMEAFSCEDVILDLRKQGVVLGKKGKADVAEESRFAYKDIDQVMNAQTDLVTPVKRLKTVGVVKG